VCLQRRYNNNGHIGAKRSVVERSKGFAKEPSLKAEKYSISEQFSCSTTWNNCCSVSVPHYVKDKIALRMSNIDLHAFSRIYTGVHGLSTKFGLSAWGFGLSRGEIDI